MAGCEVSMTTRTRVAFFHYSVSGYITKLVVGKGLAERSAYMNLLAVRNLKRERERSQMSSLAISILRGWSSDRRFQMGTWIIPE